MGFFLWFSKSKGGKSITALSKEANGRKLQCVSSYVAYALYHTAHTLSFWPPKEGTSPENFADEPLKSASPKSSTVTPGPQRMEEPLSFMPTLLRLLTLLVMRE